MRYSIILLSAASTVVAAPTYYYYPSDSTSNTNGFNNVNNPAGGGKSFGILNAANGLALLNNNGNGGQANDESSANSGVGNTFQKRTFYVTGDRTTNTNGFNNVNNPAGGGESSGFINVANGAAILNNNLNGGEANDGSSANSGVLNKYLNLGTTSLAKRTYHWFPYTSGTRTTNTNVANNVGNSAGGGTSKGLLNFANGPAILNNNLNGGQANAGSSADSGVLNTKTITKRTGWGSGGFGGFGSDTTNTNGVNNAFNTAGGGESAGLLNFANGPAILNNNLNAGQANQHSSADSGVLNGVPAIVDVLHPAKK